MINLFLKVIFLISILFSLTQCLVTRSQLAEDQNAGSRYNVPKTYNTPSKSNAPSGNQPKTSSQEVAALEYQLKSYEEQFRTMLGRIEELETKAQTGNADEAKMKDLEQAVSELLAQQEQLKSELKASREAQQAAVQKAKEQAAEDAAPATGDLAKADKLFTEGKWEKAAQEFELFRKKNPKSSEISIVTYKIGVCFQELGLKTEAKTFFNNVIKNYPNSKASKFAKFRLENLK